MVAVAALCHREAQLGKEARRPGGQEAGAVSGLPVHSGAGFGSGRGPGVGRGQSLSEGGSWESPLAKPGGHIRVVTDGKILRQEGCWAWYQNRKEKRI